MKKILFLTLFSSITYCSDNTQTYSEKLEKQLVLAHFKDYLLKTVPGIKLEDLTTGYSDSDDSSDSDDNFDTISTKAHIGMPVQNPELVNIETQIKCYKPYCKSCSEIIDELSF